MNSWVWIREHDLGVVPLLIQVRFSDLGTEFTRVRRKQRVFRQQEATCYLNWDPQDSTRRAEAHWTANRNLLSLGSFLWQGS